MSIIDMTFFTPFCIFMERGLMSAGGRRDVTLQYLINEVDVRFPVPRPWDEIVNCGLAQEVILRDDVDFLRVLLHLGMPTSLAMFGISFLFRAAEFGSFDCLVLLLEEGASVDIGDTIRDQTPLLVAAAHGNRRCVVALMMYGADRLARDMSFLSPIVMARRGGHDSVVDLLGNFPSGRDAQYSFLSDHPGTLAVRMTGSAMPADPSQPDSTTLRLS